MVKAVETVKRVSDNILVKHKNAGTFSNNGGNFVQEALMIK